jgi:hypothetical protein
MLVHVIADYGAGDLAFAEVVQRIKLHLPDAEPVLTPVPSFATLAVGFCVAQLGMNEAPPNTLIYHNVAPRRGAEYGQAQNAGERLAFARLLSGVRVIGVNAGYAFSFVRDVAKELRWVAVAAEGSQFRSRDLFPRAAAAIALGDARALSGDIELADIPEIPTGRVAYVDGYGNLKTTFRHKERKLNSGMRLRVRIGSITQEAVASDGSFSVGRDQLAYAPGSSGWKDQDGRRVCWMELFLRDGNAWKLFGRPSIGDRIQLDS